MKPESQVIFIVAKKLLDEAIVKGSQAEAAKQFYSLLYNTSNELGQEIVDEYGSKISTEEFDKHIHQLINAENDPVNQVVLLERLIGHDYMGQPSTSLCIYMEMRSSQDRERFSDLFWLIRQPIGLANKDLCAKRFNKINEFVREHGYLIPGNISNGNASLKPKI